VWRRLHEVIGIYKLLQQFFMTDIVTTRLNEWGKTIQLLQTPQWTTHTPTKPWVYEVGGLALLKIIIQCKLVLLWAQLTKIYPPLPTMVAQLAVGVHACSVFSSLWYFLLFFYPWRWYLSLISSNVLCKMSPCPPWFTWSVLSAHLG
jgi:hypothetical protein